MKIRQADQSDYYSCLEVVPPSWRSPQFDARLGAQLYYDTVFVAIEEPAHPTEESALPANPHGVSLSEVEEAQSEVRQIKTVVGFIALDTTFFDADGVYLRTLLVRDDSRHEGLGEDLMRTAIKWAFSAGARRVFSDVTNPALGKVLEKRGFEKVGEVKHMHREDEVYLIYSLRAGSPVVKELLADSTGGQSPPQSARPGNRPGLSSGPQQEGR